MHSVEACWVGSACPIIYQCVISAFYLNIQKEASWDCVRLKKKSIVTDFNRWGMGGGDNPESQSVEEKSACRSVRLSVCPSVRLSVCQSVSLSVCPSVRLSVCPSVRLSVCPSVRLSVICKRSHCLHCCSCIHISRCKDPISINFLPDRMIDFCCTFTNTCKGQCGVKWTNLCVCCTFTCNARLHSVNAKCTNLCVWLLASYPPEHLQVTVIQN